jgi:anaerobic ribonucleoside-triphosphate reductase activating protein
MQIQGKIASSRVNGPGKRAVIWLQGCRGMNCPGCWNPETHNPKSGDKVTVFDLAGWIASLDVDGVTFSGGEPMQQAPSLFSLMREAGKLRPEISFGMFTGYTLHELELGKYSWDMNGELVEGTPSLWANMKPYLDFAVMGRFNQLQATTEKPMCGSANQDIHLFTDRYSLEDFKTQFFEITISPNGDQLQLTGFPVGIHGKLTEALQS